MADYTAPAGIALINAAGTSINYATPLTVFDTTTVSGNLQGPFANTAFTISFARLGPLIVATWPAAQAAGNNTSATISFTGTIPAGFIPTTTITTFGRVINQGDVVLGSYSITNAGTFTCSLATTNVLANQVLIPNNFPAQVTQVGVGSLSCAYNATV